MTVSGKFVLLLLSMYRQLCNLLLSFPPENITYRSKKRQHYAFHEGMSLNIEIGLGWTDIEFFLQAFPQFQIGILGFWKLSLQPADLFVDTVSEMFEDILRMPGVDVVKSDCLYKVGDAVGACLSIAMRPDTPDKERPNGDAILLHECLEGKDSAVIEGAHYAGCMQGRGIALIVLDCVGIGVQYKRGGE